MLPDVMDLLLDVILPRTDLGVLLQVMVLGVLFSVFLWRLWPRSEMRLVVIGLGLFTFGLIGLRALH